MVMNRMTLQPRKMAGNFTLLIDGKVVGTIHKEGYDAFVQFSNDVQTAIQDNT